MTDYHIREDCRLCGGDLELVLDLGETALANEVLDEPGKQDVFPLRLVQCTNKACGHMQCPVVVKPERLFGHYSYTSGLTESYRQHLEKYASQVSPYLDPGDLLIEVGGNDGTLGAARDIRGRDIRYLNIDPSDVEQESGMRIRSFFGEKLLTQRILAEHGKARVIVANHVFAHVDDLRAMADAAYELLEDNGTLFVEVGNGPTQLNSGCLDVIYHEHLSFHDPLSFTKFFSRHGLVVEGGQYNQAQGGAMRLALVKANRAAGLMGLAAYGETHRFNVPLIKEKARELRGLGRSLGSIDAGESEYGDPPVAVYGAPAKLTSLCALMQWRPGVWGDGAMPDEVVVFDDSPRKVGKYTPGSHKVITVPTLDALNQHAFILIASWNFEKEIRERWSGYKGTWIVPLPNVRFIPGGGA